MLSFSRTANHSANRILLFRNKSGLREVNNAVCGSNNRWRGRSHAASVPSDSPEPQRSRGRVSKEKRRALVKSYVNKFRAEHDGKFPTASATMKNVGGSYYVVRLIIQEIEYKSKISSSDKETAQNELHVAAADDVEIDASEKPLYDEGATASSVAGNTMSEDDVKSTVPGDLSGPFATPSGLLNGNSENISHSSLGRVEDEKPEEAQGHYSDFVTESHTVKKVIEENFQKYHETVDLVKEKTEYQPSSFVEKESRLPEGETEKVSHPSVGYAYEKKEQIISEASLDSRGQKQEPEQHNLPHEPEKNAMDISSKQTEDEPPKKSTMWENLKSFADGFIKMWRQ